MRPGAKFILIASLVGIVVGSYGMFERLAYGLNPVAFGSYVPWGLWVSFYLFFLGLSAGAFLVTTLAYVFGMKRLEALAPLSAFTVLVCLLCEGLFILLDLGTVSRAFYQFFLSPSFTSLLTWMLVLFSAMGVIYALKTYLLVRGGDRGTVKFLSWINARRFAVLWDQRRFFCHTCEQAPVEQLPDSASVHCGRTTLRRCTSHS